MAFMIILLRAKNEDLRENGNKNDKMGLGLVNSAIPVVLHHDSSSDAIVQPIGGMHICTCRCAEALQADPWAKKWVGR